MPHLPPILALAVLMLLPAAPVSADPSVTTEAVNVRSGPGTRFRVIDALPRRAALEIESCEPPWCFDADGNHVMERFARSVL